MKGAECRRTFSSGLTNGAVSRRWLSGRARVFMSDVSTPLLESMGIVFWRCPASRMIFLGRFGVGFASMSMSAMSASARAEAAAASAEPLSSSTSVSAVIFPASTIGGGLRPKRQTQRQQRLETRLAATGFTSRATASRAPAMSIQPVAPKRCSRAFASFVQNSSPRMLCRSLVCMAKMGWSARSCLCAQTSQAVSEMPSRLFRNCLTSSFSTSARLGELAPNVAFMRKRQSSMRISKTHLAPPTA
mmetsp:Transcript_4870/g.18004  ORF Transcript_4870/g.18004 Transcript_4870/m.18004 type:complete len:246 (-) Transcript_4870:362-1099(-)